MTLTPLDVIPSHKASWMVMLLRRTSLATATEEPSPIVAPILFILQLLSYEIAVKKGINPDKPRNLAKSVTVR